MEVLLVDWISLALRWAHVMAGIAWIGSSFYFVFLDASLRRRHPPKPGVAGESWMVHGGGFYRIEKYSVAPERLPEELHWFKYEAYFTWLTAFCCWPSSTTGAPRPISSTRRSSTCRPMRRSPCLLSRSPAGWFVYDRLCRSPLGAKTVPLAAAVFCLVVLAAFGYGLVFSGRAAFLHCGILIGTLMAANVFAIIIPNQKKTVAALTAGEPPDPAWVAQAKQRSLHNNYLTLPVILMMVSNHYPLLFAQGRGWITAAGIIVVGALIRHFFNLRNAGRRDRSFPFLLPAALAVGLLLLALTAIRPAGSPEDVAFEEIAPLIRTHCTAVTP